ncbi:phenolic glucoside malonyltransferase 1-like [Populus alba x Populus x berolinensis]|nr:phenolic glucoside malonyltransferase 1-like [Populus alba x Populus x berolinensis]
MDPDMESDNMFTVLQHCQVSPPPGTTSEKSLPLTFFDLRMVDSSTKHLFFFECTSISKNHFLESIIPSLKHSLSLSLKYYYPFAGNLIFPPNSGKPEIRYLERDSASLIFAESSSDFIHLTGKQTRNTTEFLSFLPQLPPEPMSHDTLVVPISSFQVTLFPDSGICVGFHLRHAIGDGNSVVKSFFKTWASITKAGGDATFLSGEFVPYYDRTRFRDPEGLEFETIVWNDLEKITKEEWSRPHQPKPNNKVRATFVISQATAQQLKKLVLGRYPFPSHISTFTVTCGYVWSCLAKARAACGKDDDEMVHFLTEVDWRTRLDPPLPATYFGNCVLPSLACAKTPQLKGSDGFVIGAKSIGDAIHKSLHHTGGVSKTVKNLARQLAAASKGWLLECFSSPKFKMYDIDFGWGRLKTNEELSIDDCEAIAVGDGQNEGETEIIVSNPKPIMDAFVSIFSLGLRTLDEEVKKLGANNFIRSKI